MKEKLLKNEKSMMSSFLPDTETVFPTFPLSFYILPLTFKFLLGVLL